RFRNSWLPGLAKDLLDEAAPKLSKSIRRASKGSSRSRSDDSADDGNLDGSPPPADEPASDEPEPTEDESAAPAAEQPAEGAFEADPGAISDEATSESEDESPSRIVGAISARAGIVHRSFGFSDDIYDRLRKQD